MDKSALLIILVIGVLGFLVFFVIGLYNMIINRKNKVNDKWEEIEKLLNKKAIIFSKLADITKDKLDNEELVKIAINNKNKLLNTMIINEKIKANSRVDDTIGEIRNRCDDKLNSDEVYVSVIERLNDINEKLDYSKEFYNKAVDKYNNIIKKFPFNIVAVVFDFKYYSLYEQ